MIKCYRDNMEKEKKKNKIKAFFTLTILLIISLILYSHFLGTKGLIIREYAVINNKVPESFNGIKIVHFTDLHYGSTIKNKEIKKIVNVINNLNPDLVVFTGDLIEEPYHMTDNEIEQLSNELNKIEANLGKYIIRGNHDVNEAFSKVLDKIDFKHLNNKNELIYYNSNTPIMLIGLDDYLKFDLDIEEAFNYEKNDYYTIVLAHDYKL